VQSERRYGNNPSQQYRHGLDLSSALDNRHDIKRHRQSGGQTVQFGPGSTTHGSDLAAADAF